MKMFDKTTKDENGEMPKHSQADRKPSEDLHPVRTERQADRRADKMR